MELVLKDRISTERFEQILSQCLEYFNCASSESSKEPWKVFLIPYCSLLSKIRRIINEEAIAYLQFLGRVEDFNVLYISRAYSTLQGCLVVNGVSMTLE